MDFLKRKKQESSQNIIDQKIKEVIEAIAEKQSFVTSDEFFTHLVQMGYQFLPAAIRLFVTEQAFVSAINENKDKVFTIISGYIK